MRNKKIVTLFTAALLAGSLGTGAIIASAGTVESKPAGDGLITSKSELNLTNFKIVETEAGDADAYVAGKSNDYVIEYNEGEWQEMLVGSPVPKEIMAKEGAYATIRMPSGEMRLIPVTCRATIGQVGNLEHEIIRVGKAGKTRHLGVKPTVRGSVMNPNDHPHGGGEGKSPVGHAGPETPWGKPALGYKTRKKKNATNKFILKRIN